MKQIKIKQDGNIISVIFPNSLDTGRISTSGGKEIKKSSITGEQAAKEFHHIMLDMFEDEMEDHWIEKNTFGFVANKGKFY